MVQKTMTIDPGGYPAVQPGLLCNEDKVLWPSQAPCRHILAIQQLINPPKPWFSINAPDPFNQPP